MHQHQKPEAFPSGVLQFCCGSFVSGLPHQNQIQKTTPTVGLYPSPSTSFASSPPHYAPKSCSASNASVGCQPAMATGFASSPPHYTFESCSASNFVLWDFLLSLKSHDSESVSECMHKPQSWTETLFCSGIINQE